MKRVFLSLAVIAMIGLFSCNTEKTCECTTDIAGMTSTAETTIEDGDCSDMDSSTTAMGVTTKVTCVEK